MIEVDAPNGLLQRFVDDLDAQTPFELLDCRPVLAAATSADVEAARIAWATRIVDEYRSVIVFSELLQHLAEAEAPFATLCAVQRLIGDELRHTSLCALAVQWLGGFDGLEIDLGGLGLPSSNDPACVRALEIVVRELVVAETESVIVLAAYRDATEDPALRRVLSIILADEVRHAAAGRELTKVLVRTFPREVIQPLLSRLSDTVADDLEYIRGSYRGSAVDGPGRRLGGSLRPGDLPTKPAVIEPVWLDPIDPTRGTHPPGETRLLAAD